MGNLDFWNFLIAVIALFLSIYAIVYAHIQNALKIDITNGYRDKNGNDPHLFGFTIENLSSKPVKLIGVSIKNRDGKEINILENFEPTQTYYHDKYLKIPDIIGNYWYDSPFERPVNIQPNNDVDFSYYSNDNFSNELMIIASFQSLGILKNKKQIKSFVALQKND